MLQHESFQNKERVNKQRRDSQAVICQNESGRSAETAREALTVEGCEASEEGSEPCNLWVTYSTKVFMLLDESGVSLRRLLARRS